MCTNSMFAVSAATSLYSVISIVDNHTHVEYRRKTVSKYTTFGNAFGNVKCLLLLRLRLYNVPNFSPKGVAGNSLHSTMEASWLTRPRTRIAEPTSIGVNRACERFTLIFEPSPESRTIVRSVHDATVPATTTLFPLKALS